MATNKELFYEQMSNLTEALNKKNQASGNKTIDELVEASANLKVSDFTAIYIDGENYALNPVTLEPYLGWLDHMPTQEEINTAINQMCVDYNLTIETIEGERYVYAPVNTDLYGVIPEQTDIDEFPIVKSGWYEGGNSLHIMIDSLYGYVQVGYFINIASWNPENEQSNPTEW